MYFYSVLYFVVPDGVSGKYWSSDGTQLGVQAIDIHFRHLVDILLFLWNVFMAMKCTYASEQMRNMFSRRRNALCVYIK